MDHFYIDGCYSVLELLETSESRLASGERSHIVPDFLML